MFPGRPIRAFVVWEPVLPTDWGSPTTGVMSRVHDPRVTQYWDRSHLLSESLGGPERFDHGGVSKIEFDMRSVIWDFVSIYPAGADHPSFTGAPIVSVVEDVRQELARVAKN